MSDGRKNANTKISMTTALESCPGLTQLWERPFRAEYAAADGKLVLRFRLTNEGIEVAADITK